MFVSSGRRPGRREGRCRPWLDAVLLAALDSQALVPAVAHARENGIPVATFDSGVDGAVVTHVGTDNRSAGARAARELGALIGGGGTVGMIIHDAGSETGARRRDGFIEEMQARYPDVSLLPPRYGLGDHELSAELTRELLAAHPEMNAVFAANEGSAIGAAEALSAPERSDIVLVAFDAAPEQVEFLRTGVIDGLVVQDPFNMGYLGVQALYKHLQGAEVPQRIETAVTYVTAENVESPEVRRLLHPDRDAW